MRFSNTLLLALPALAIAEQAQIPLADKVKGWFGKASSYISEAAPAPSKAAAAFAAKVASQKVTNLTLENYKDVLKPDPSVKHTAPEEWMIYIDGGNKTCYGMCENATAAWNLAVPILSALPTGPKLGYLNCEVDNVLCNTWVTGPPTIYHFLLPVPLADQSKPATTVRSIRLNTTSVTSQDIVNIHTKSKYKDTEPYEGIFHPFDGPLAQTGANVYLGYLITLFAKMPGWLPMIAVSFISRSFMGRRMNPGGAAGAPAGGAAPAPAR